MVNFALVKKPPAEQKKIVNKPASVIFSSASVIFYSYLCVVGNGGDQPTTEANNTFLCDDA